jgi:hypothetical protein
VPHIPGPGPGFRVVPLVHMSEHPFDPGRGKVG